MWKTKDGWNTLQAHGGCCDVIQDQRLNEDARNALLVDNWALARPVCDGGELPNWHLAKWGWLYAIRVKSYNPLLRMVDRFFLVHNCTCSRIPGQRGESNFFGLRCFCRWNFFIPIWDTNSYKKREDLFVSPNSLFLTACAGRLRNKTKKSHLVWIRTIQFV